MNMIDLAIEHPEQLSQQASALQQAGARLLCMTASDERDHRLGLGSELEFCIHTFWLKDGQVTHLHCALGSNSGLFYPSLTPHVAAAYWYEREIYDMFGIKAVGHPDASHLVVHADWPADIFPMRKDYQGPLPGRVSATQCEHGEHDGHDEHAEHACLAKHADLPDGLVRIPVGPVHAGIIEPGHFHFTAVGEEVFALSPQFSYVHRGLEKAAEGHTPMAALPLAERVCGVCTVAHSWSYCLAVEQLAKTTIPARAELIRVILGELERLHNHVGDIGNICAGAGLTVANNHGLYLRERLMRLNETLFDHRFLRGCIVPGGVRSDLDSRMLDQTMAELEYVVQEAASLAEDCIEHDIFRNRMAGTGVLERDLAVQLGVTGVAARASGIARDTRADLAYGGYVRYERLPFAIQTEQTGDVQARFLMRVREIKNSLAIIREAFNMLQPGAIQVPIGALSKAGQAGAGQAGAGQAGRTERIALGATESARGENIHLLMVDESGIICRWFVRSASFTNWPAVVLAVPGNIVPDFPIINKSFELCYACLDR